MNCNNNNNNTVRTRLRSDAVRFANVEAACVSGSVAVKRGPSPDFVDLEAQVPVSFDETFCGECDPEVMQQNVKTLRVAVKAGFVSTRKVAPGVTVRRGGIAWKVVCHDEEDLETLVGCWDDNASVATTC